jgi:hypothetical protein
VLSCVVLAGFSASVRAEPVIGDAEMVIRLSVYPMAAPRPALRYLLLPELKEMNPGNPIPNYLRCLLDQDFTSDQETLGRSALRLADWAARLDKPDWQILPRAKTDGIGLLLPDLQKLRQLAAALQVRFREEVTQRRFDDAIRTAKTMFALARHTGEHPTLIGDLVGIAIATITIAPLEEMLEQPGCPNLYWALTNLPCPLVHTAKGIEGERLLIQSELRELDEHAPMNAELIGKLIAHIDNLHRFDGNPTDESKSTRKWLAERIKDKKTVRAASQRLVDVGFREKQLAQFPVEQVLLLDAKREYEARRDEVMKLMNLATWEAEAALRGIKRPTPPSLFDFLLPGMDKVRRAQGRLEQRIALLRHVEALRIYAAEHDGRLPQKLADITVPLPVDPFTGQPFRYAMDGATAHLRGSPPPGAEKMPVYNLHYEVTIQK